MIMFSTSSVYVISLLLFLSHTTQALVSSSNTSLCNERERQALLKFKQAAPDGILSLWVGFDCCKWVGVRCNNITGHVTVLDLRGYIGVSGEIDSSLLELKHLRFLDLSDNYFGQIPIPEFFGSLKKLKYLALSNTDFRGKIPHQLGNLSTLSHLDLNYNVDLQVESLDWLAHLSHLKYLDMASLNLGSTLADEPQIMNKLPSLSVLRLSYCGLIEFPTLSNLTSLTSLDLSSNSISSKFPDWLVELHSLVDLDLSSNGISSKFPDWLVELHSLVDLDLSSNSLEGPIPTGHGRLCNLRSLDLSNNYMDGEIYGFLENLSRCGMDNFEKYGKFMSIRSLNFKYNNFSGTLPESLGQLSELEYFGTSHNSLEGVLSEAHFANLAKLETLDLSSNSFIGTLSEAQFANLTKLETLDLSSNSFVGILSEAHFANLTKLETLDLSSNSFVLNILREWVPPFQLKYIRLGSCNLGPQFPMWLRFQEDYTELDLYNAQISDALPEWFWNSSSRIVYLNISQNKINGRLPASLELSPHSSLDISSNRFEGPLPYNVSNAYILDLSSNLFSGPIIMNFEYMAYLSLSNNRLNGSVPSSFCHAEMVFALDLSKNKLSGQIPKCWEHNMSLKVLDLSNNSLSGEIPTFAHGFTWLQLSHNSFSGTFPSFKNPLKFVGLDLSNNRLSGLIPTWIGDEMSNLMVLNLRSNVFDGNIPPQLAELSSLKILDLANNRLSHSIPSTFGNFTGMKFAWDPTYNLKLNGSEVYEVYMVVIMKRLELKYTKTLGLVAAIDLSGNNLSGEIPKELASLHQLKTLNLSGNHLGGKIPENIGELQQLESLDLSRNHLSGTIPSSITRLNFLSSLNLSYNNLSGRIPSGNQIQTLVDLSIYAGNRDLCGPPVSKTCPGEEVSQAPKAMVGGDEGNVIADMWFYVSMALGFVVGFWCFCGPLLLCKSWRIAYYRFFDHLNSWFYVLFFNMVVKIRKK